jgi:hypothetical protein
MLTGACQKIVGRLDRIDSEAACQLSGMNNHWHHYIELKLSYVPQQL